MSITIGLIVLAVLIGFVCYTNRSPIHTERFRPKDILDQVD